MKRETFGRCLLLAVCLLLVGTLGNAGQTAKRVTDFIFVRHYDTPSWIRWNDVAFIKLYDDNGGPESYWEIHIKGLADNPLILKDAYSYPEIMNRVKDSVLRP